MKLTITQPTWALFITGVFMFAASGDLRGQEAPEPRFAAMALPNRTMVVIAVTENIPDPTQDVLIVRRTSLTPNDVILVRQRALTPATLARAVQTLQMTRGRMGRVPTKDAWVRVDTRASGHPPRSNEAVNWVDALKALNPMSLPGVGVVPLLVLHPSDDEIPR